VNDTHVHALLSAETEPRGDLCIRTLAMPADTNQSGDIFGGWLLSQRILAAACSPPGSQDPAP
jgi:acyl-CoA thioesterase YciA